MAEAFLNPAFTALNGRIGDVVFYSFGGRVFFRAYVKPRNPDTPAQRRNRRLFSDAMRAWRGLSAFEKGSYNHRARRVGMTGHNLFISRYMTSHAAGEGGRPSVGVSRLDLKTLCGFSSPLHVQGRSVSGFIPARRGAERGGSMVFRPDG